MAEAKTVRSITGRQTTAGAAEETLLLSVDGATAASTVSVPAGTRVVITDVMPSGGAISDARWRIQQTNNGSTFFDIGLFEVRGADAVATPIYKYGTGLIIEGGASVAFRVRVESTGGISLVHLVLRSYREP